MMRLQLSALVVITYFTGFGTHFVNATIEETPMPDGTTKMSFSTPDMDDDEAHSMFMPDMLKCDACTIIAYQVRAYHFH